MKKETRNKLVALIQEVLTEAKQKQPKSAKMTKVKNKGTNTKKTPAKSITPVMKETAKPLAKMPKAKKPAKPSIGKKKSLKESILEIIREEITEMARTPMTVNNGVVSGAGAKFIVADPASKTGFSLKGHPKFPDGTPAMKPKGPYVPKGDTGMGRPAAAPVTSAVVTVDGKSLGEFSLSPKLPSGKPDMTPLHKRVRQFIYGDPDMAAYEIDPSVIAKFEKVSDLEFDGQLTNANRNINLRVVNDKLVA